MTKQFPKYSKSLAFAVELASKAYKDLMKNIYKKMDFEINHEEYLVLETIESTPGIIQKEISDKIIMKIPYVCKFLYELEVKGFIRKEQDIRGRRQIIYRNYLTEKGEKIYRKVRNYLGKHVDNLENKIEYDDFVKIRDYLFHWVDLLKADKANKSN